MRLLQFHILSVSTSLTTIILLYCLYQHISFLYLLSILKTKGYSFSKRGMIRIRGKGPVSTFFLTSSEKVHSSKPDTVQSATPLRQSSPADNGIELRQPSSTNLRSSSGKSTANNKIHPDVFNKNWIYLINALLKTNTTRIHPSRYGSVQVHRQPARDVVIPCAACDQYTWCEESSKL